jgi:hypothetical protein
MSVQLLEYNVVFFVSRMRRFSREIKIIHERNQVKNYVGRWVKGVVVFIKEIFNLVKRRNVVINYNDHNLLCLFFLAQTEMDTLMPATLGQIYRLHERNVHNN